MDQTTNVKINNTKFVSFNCHSVKSSVGYIRKLCQTSDFIALQETWLLPEDIPYLGEIDQDFAYFGKSAVDTSSGILKGRPYGGVALLWRKSVFRTVSIIDCTSERIVAVKVVLDSREFLVMSVYMPTDSAENFETFLETLSKISAIVETSNVEAVYILGDFNAHPGAPFGRELLSFCAEEGWVCADIEYLGIDSCSYTYLSDAHGSTSWLDHVITTEVAKKSILHANIIYEMSWSDHFALELTCNLDIVVPKVEQRSSVLDDAVWGERDEAQIKQYWQLCSSKLRDVNFPAELHMCADVACSNLEHRTLLDKMYSTIVGFLKDAASKCSKRCSKVGQKKRNVTGWNKHCKEAHREARLRFQEWVDYGKPRKGRIFDEMKKTRKVFKSKLKWCKNNETQIKMDILATQHNAKNFKQFWKETNKLNPRPSVPVSIEGISDTDRIANMFRDHFIVESSLALSDTETDAICGERQGEPIMQITAKQVAKVVKDMKRGKSPGHDSLSIEHLQHAGFHLPRVLAMFFTLCIGHSYLPEALMKTLVVPITKNKTGDVSSICNYRPISLATVIAKVLDGVIEIQLSQHVKLHDAQFGFRPGLSTEAAILSLKHTVQYYTSRSTPVYACFLDLSKAFDLVAYDRLWQKLAEDTDLPVELIQLLKFWYGNQDNVVKWSGSLSEVYRLQCGVRQGGLTSPVLFNLYMDSLIRELSGAGVGCSVDGVFVNNISYADDMVLLGPSVRALKKLIAICERYAEAHGLRYNATKSELMVFKSGSKTYTVPPIELNGYGLKVVSTFKYLGHWVTESLADDVDMERERRALCIRANMLARRFARCTKQVKATLFRAYCQSFYTCNLWVCYTKNSHNTLRIQYNNAYRSLVGLPTWCSASGMFADARLESFGAIVRKRVASLIRRVRDSSNSHLQLIASRMDLDCSIMQHWTRLHIEHSGSKPKYKLR